MGHAGFLCSVYRKSGEGRGRSDVWVALIDALRERVFFLSRLIPLDSVRRTACEYEWNRYSLRCCQVVTGVCNGGGAPRKVTVLKLFVGPFFQDKVRQKEKGKYGWCFRRLVAFSTRVLFYTRISQMEGAACRAGRYTWPGQAK